MGAWQPTEFTYDGQYIQVPSVRLWPTPVNPPGKVLLQAVNSPESVEASIARGLPPLMARPLNPFVEQVEEFRSYRALLEDKGLDPSPFLERATVLKYIFLAPTREEARALAREAFEWDIEILQRLTTPTTTEMPKGYSLYEQRGGQLPEFVYDDWAENVLLFDDPAGCADKIAMLRDAGVQRLLLWVGPGGVEHELAVRSMRLFAEQVMPKFRSR